MAGIQIDGVNNKIDFDDDLDTSISANTDDTLVIEAGGNTMATITATTFTINDGTTITTADNTDTLSLISTDTDDNSGPNLRMYRNSGSPGDNYVIGQIQFEGKNDAAQDVIYNDISMKIQDASDGTEDGIIRFRNMQAGTLRQYISTSGTETVFNEDSVDIDFRVESNGNANMIFVDGGNNHVCIGTSTDHGGVLNVDGPILMSESDSLLLRITSSSSDVKFQQRVSDKDIRFEGIDGGSDITALHLDMSDNGFAIFSGNGRFGTKINVGGSSTTLGSLISRLSPIGSTVFAASGGMHTKDDRDPKPGDFPTGQYSNFANYAGDGGGAPYADVMVLDTFGHSSGGNANAIFISKADVNDIKIAQQSTQSTSTFAAGTQTNIDTTSISDASVKENVQTITDCLSKVAQLRPVTFEWTDEYINNGMSKNASEKTYTAGELATFYTDDDELPEGKEVGDIKTEGSAPTRVIPTTKTTNVGLIAQEVEAVIPTVVHQNRVSLAGSEDYQKNVDYDKLVPHLIGAIKELKARIEVLEG